MTPRTPANTRPTDPKLTAALDEAAAAVRARTPSSAVESSVLDAAAALLEAEGPHALSIRRIASAAGVSPMSIYNRFEGKGGVLDALFIRGFARLAVVSSRVDLEADPTRPLEQLRDAADLYRAFALADPGTYALMFDRAVADFEPSPAGQDAAAGCFDRLVASVAAVQATGALVGGDPVELAQRMWATMHGAVSLERRGICFAPSTDQHYAALVETLFLGMRADTGVAGGATPGAGPASGARPTRPARPAGPAPRR